MKLTGMKSWARGNPYGWNQEWIDMCGGMSWSIEWWKGEQSPVSNPKWFMRCYWQGDRDLNEFFSYIQQEELKLKSIHIANFGKLKDLFPVLDWEIDEEEFYFSVRVKTKHGGGNSASPVSLKDDGFEDMKKWLAAKAWKKETKIQLMAKYPFLYFAPDSSSSSGPTSPGMAAIIGYGGTQWKVFLTYEYEGRDCCGTSTGYYFEWPITQETAKRLSELNQESEQSQQDGWFFCTVCQIAKPRHEYGYYYFAETRCKDCLEPVWEKCARAETYN